MVTATEQAAQLERVTSRIGMLILAFARDRLRSQSPTFHMAELADFVGRDFVAAPDSAGRILRHLRAQGAVRYQLVSRRRSEYRIDHVEGV